MDDILFLCIFVYLWMILDFVVYLKTWMISCSYVFCSLLEVPMYFVVMDGYLVPMYFVVYLKTWMISCSYVFCSLLEDMDDILFLCIL